MLCFLINRNFWNEEEILNILCLLFHQFGSFQFKGVGEIVLRNDSEQLKGKHPTNECCSYC